MVYWDDVVEVNVLFENLKMLVVSEVLVIVKKFFYDD